MSDPEDPNTGNVREWVLNSPHTQRQAVWILAGGDSVERQASLAAGQHVLQQLLMQPDIQVWFSCWLPTAWLELGQLASEPARSCSTRPCYGMGM